MIRRTDRFELEFGRESIQLTSAFPVDLISLPETAALPDPKAAVLASLMHPLSGPSLEQVARAALTRKPDATAIIVVSDNTRPVPYRGDDSILIPVVEVLEKAGVTQIRIIVATGTHTPLPEAMLRALLPECLFGGRTIILNHDCRNSGSLCHLGRTPRGTEVWLNRNYVEADIKILTGLVEPHFMAGVSGGAKSICPGLSGEKVTYGFHSAKMMADARACSLNLFDNPCYEESKAVAAMAGSDFVINATINRAKRLAGVFAGSLDAAHKAAAAAVVEEAGIRIDREYDAVVTHAGFAGINHYQAAKAAVEGVRAVREGGTLVLLANNTDKEPVGGPNYRSALPMLRELGPDAFERKVLAAEWQFVPEQWEVQMWGRAFRKLGSQERLIYCSPQLTGSEFTKYRLPGVDGGAGMSAKNARELAQVMVQNAIDRIPAGAAVAVLADGPYAVPLLPKAP